MSEAKRCKNCKEPYTDHLRFILDEWDNSDPLRYSKANEKLHANECHKFVLMNNLELLEWEYEKKTLGSK
jgi:hypothetical protein